MKITLKLMCEKKCIATESFYKYDFWMSEMFKDILNQLNIEWVQKTDTKTFHSGWPRTFSFEDPPDIKLARWLINLQYLNYNQINHIDKNIIENDNTYGRAVVKWIKWKNVWDRKKLKYIVEKYGIHFKYINDFFDFDKWVNKIIYKNCYLKVESNNF